MYVGVIADADNARIIHDYRRFSGGTQYINALLARMNRTAAMSELCQCEYGSKVDKLECFKNKLRELYRSNETYDSTIEEQLSRIDDLSDFNFVDTWDLRGGGGNAIGGSVTAHKNNKIASQVIVSNLILVQFFSNLSKDHITYQKVVRLPESSIHTHVFKNSI